MSVGLGLRLVFFVHLFRFNILCVFWFSLDYLWPPIVMGRSLFIFFSCGFYLFLSFSFFFFSSPILSGRTLDVYHTLTHDVALARI